MKKFSILYILLLIFFTYSIFISFQLFKWKYRYQDAIQREAIGNNPNEAYFHLRLLAEKIYTCQNSVYEEVQPSEAILATESKLLDEGKIVELPSTSYFRKFAELAEQQGIFSSIVQAAEAPAQNQVKLFSPDGDGLYHKGLARVALAFRYLTPIISYQCQKLLQQGEQDKAITLLISWHQDATILFPRYLPAEKLLRQIYHNNSLTKSNHAKLMVLLQTLEEKHDPKI